MNRAGCEWSLCYYEGQLKGNIDEAIKCIDVYGRVMTCAQLDEEGKRRRRLGGARVAFIWRGGCSPKALPEGSAGEL